MSRSLTSALPRCSPVSANHRTSYVGTTAYISREQFDLEAHGRDYDPFSADMWSLGVTVLELLVGRYPLFPAGQKPSWAVLMCAICFGEPPALLDGHSEVLAWEREVFGSCLSVAIIDVLAGIGRVVRGGGRLLMGGGHDQRGHDEAWREVAQGGEHPA
ncbi:hypothetical protein E2562_001462 [Oryza meyeriana var. granulata]|uniref:Protein kinase domain-containing protein n=1 Tax=Oryza meyeriana var. granulata TaxID=110450 RepID=A0A6G1DCX4_9ORYZ|nr:hypothetical protein E2562_001462 [Oryza meyeriana var. granulata]